MYAKNTKNNLNSIFLKYDLQNLLPYISYFKTHPVHSVVLGVVIAFYTVPIAIYVAFSIAAFVVTFVGFLIILGGILLVGFLVLSSVLAAITVIVIFMLIVSWIPSRLCSQLSQISELITSNENESQHPNVSSTVCEEPS